MKAVSLMVAILSTACLAKAAEGDVTTRTFTKATGNSVILEIGECRMMPQTDFDGKPYIEIELQYAVCEELVTYDADVVDKGWWQTEVTNVRNQRSSTETRIRTFSRSNQFNTTKISNTGDALADALGKVGSVAIDSTRLLNECNAKKEALAMSTRVQNSALLRACGK